MARTDKKRHIPAHGRLGAGKSLHNHIGGFLPGRNDGPALGNPFEKSRKVCCRNDFKELVRSIVLQAPYLAGGVVESDSMLDAESLNPGLIKTFIPGNGKPILVLKENQPHHTPEVVVPIRIEKWHAPALWLRRKASQKQHAGMFRQEGFERMFFSHRSNLSFFPLKCLNLKNRIALLMIGLSLYDSMLAAADPSQVSGLSRFFKCAPGEYGEGDKFLGIKVPVTREIVSRCWRDTDFEELERCIASEYHEIRLAALLTLVEIFRHAKKNPALQERCIDFYLSHTEYINNWDLVDLSCYPLLGEWLLPRKDRSLLYELARYGKTIWEQRIGMVSTMTFIRHGELEDTFAIADILLHHPHDLIHKAAGWLLREAGKRDGNALRQYLLSEGVQASQGSGTPRYKTMPRTMLRYAIEKFPEEERQRYLRGNASPGCY